MGHTRFRRSMKIAPGVRINFNKNSVGVSFGGKGAHYTINSSGRRTASVGIPGTGLYYTESTGGGAAKSSGNPVYNNSDSFVPPKSDLEFANKRLKANKRLYIAAIVFCVGFLLTEEYVLGVIFGIAAVLLVALERPKLKAAKASEETKALGLQELITGQHGTALMFSPRELNMKAYSSAHELTSNFNEAITTMSKANDPITFFDAYEDARSSLDELVKFEPYIRFDESTPSDLAKAMEDNKDAMFLEFIQEYFKETKKKASDLTTVKGRNGRYQRFYENLKPYFEYMNDECIRFVEDSYRGNIEES